ncbi:MAG: hypothetical protein K6F32_01275 [Bacilli bacterium]|nr:hypothetical protein [Bacilli bacterium]
MKKISALVLAAASVSLCACNSDPTSQQVTRSAEEFKAAYTVEAAKDYSGLGIEGSIDFSHLDDEGNVLEAVEIEGLKAELTVSDLPIAFVNLFTGSALRNLSAYISGSATKFYVYTGDNFEADINEASVQTWLDKGDLYFDYTDAKLDDVKIDGEPVAEGTPQKVFIDGLLDGLNFELDSSYVDEYGLAYAKFGSENGYDYLEFKVNRDEMVALYVAPLVYNYTMSDAMQVPEGMRADAIAAYRATITEQAMNTLEEFNLAFRIQYNTSGLGAISIDANGIINLDYEVTGEVDPTFPQVRFDVDLNCTHRARDGMPSYNASEFVKA